MMEVASLDNVLLLMVAEQHSGGEVGDHDAEPRQRTDRENSNGGCRVARVSRGAHCRVSGIGMTGEGSQSA